MSSILKALKKLEAEKTLSQESSAVNISRDILQPKPLNRRLVIRLWIAGSVALGTIITLVALLLMRPALRDVPGNSAPVVAPAPGEHLVPAPAAISAPVLLPAPDKRRAAAALPPTAEKSRQQNQPALQPAPLPQPVTEGTSRTEMPEQRPPLAETPRGEVGKKPPQPALSEKADTSLTLSGIAWNKDSADRLAIINGQPTATGASIGGVVVEEIMPDRVKVNRSGHTFDIFLGKNAKPN